MAAAAAAAHARACGSERREASAITDTRRWCDLRGLKRRARGARLSLSLWQAPKRAMQGVSLWTACGQTLPLPTRGLMSATAAALARRAANETGLSSKQEAALAGATACGLRPTLHHIAQPVACSHPPPGGSAGCLPRSSWCNERGGAPPGLGTGAAHWREKNRRAVPHIARLAAVRVGLQVSC